MRISKHYKVLTAISLCNNDAVRKLFFKSGKNIVSLAAVFRLVMQRSSPEGEERCVTSLKMAAKYTRQNGFLYFGVLTCISNLCKVGS